MNVDSEFERKFVPKGSIKCGKKCFDIVDKWCTRILTKIETGDNWNKIIEREICLLKIKYPFLSDKQIRGKALQKFGIPNTMGDIVRCGANRVRGNIAKELNHLNVKKEPRIPPPFRMIRRNESVDKVKKETKPNSSSSTELFTKTENNSEINEDPIDENFNSTPRKKQLTNPRKCLLKRFRIPHESDTDDETVEQPRKKIKIEQIDLHEIQENSKYYISQDKSVNQSFLEESTNENGDDDSNNDSQGEENLQMKRMIYSQFSESGKKYLTSFSDWRLTQEDRESQQTIFNYQNNAESAPSECDYPPVAASPIVPVKSKNSGTFRNTASPHVPAISKNSGTFSNHQRAQENNKLLMKNPFHSGNDKVKNSFFTIPKKSINNSKDQNVLMNRILKEVQKSSDTNIEAITNQYFSLSNFGRDKFDSDLVSRLDECFSYENNYFDKENECPHLKRGIINENRNYKPLFEVCTDKNRRILGDINFPLIEIHSDISEIDSNASTQIISQNNDKDSSGGEGTQPIDETQFSLPENSSRKALSEISQNIEQNLHLNEILSEELTQINTQSPISLSPLPTDNSQDNPWLNLTSQDFSQNYHNYNQRELTQDSGKATQDSIASDFSFITVSSSSSPEMNTGTLQDLFHVKMATIKRTIAIILAELEREDAESQGE